MRTAARPVLIRPSALRSPSTGAGAPSSTTFLRLDFKMTVTIGASTETVLAFQQLLSVDAAGNVTALKYALSRYTLTSAAAQSGKEGRVPPTKTMMPALESTPKHPLVKIDQKATSATIVVNAEFVDATLLFWDLHAAGDQWRRAEDLIAALGPGVFPGLLHGHEERLLVGCPALVLPEHPLEL